MLGGTDRFSAEQLMQETLFWIYENQQVEVEYQGKKFLFTFEIGDEIVDNSDLVQYNSSGKLYRYSLNIQLQATLLRSENYFTALHPNIEVIPENNIKEEN